MLDLLLTRVALGLLPLANFSTVPTATWCGNLSGQLSAASVNTFATKPFVVFEKDMAQFSPPVGAAEELKIAAAALAVRAASRRLRPDGPITQVYMYQTVGSLLPQYSMSEWFAQHAELLLRDDQAKLVTVTYNMMGRNVTVPWVDFSQPAAVQGWVGNLYQWVANGSVDGIALDGNPYDNEWIHSEGGSPGILANISNVTKRNEFLLGLNRSQAALGRIIAQAGGVLMANGVHKDGDNGMLFEEWCGEHSYLRRRQGCEGSRSPIACDMLILQRYSSNTSNVAFVHIADTAAKRNEMSANGVVKLAAFLWAAGPRAFFADVPPLPKERAHWQCDEWAAVPPFIEFSKPLGKPAGPGEVSVSGVYTRKFAHNASVMVDLRSIATPKACIVWADGTKSGTCNADNHSGTLTSRSGANLSSGVYIV